jgi:hypothetical protein
VYANSLNGKFIWDDEYLITNNLYIKSLKNMALIFTKDLGAGAFVQYNYYRPLQIFTYMLDYSIWGSNRIMEKDSATQSGFCDSAF